MRASWAPVLSFWAVCIMRGEPGPVMCLLKRCLAVGILQSIRRFVIK